MNVKKVIVLVSTLFALGFCVFSTPARAATPSYTISATNVTMSSSASSGTGLTNFKLTSVNGYSGTVGVNCYPTTQPAGAQLPYCGGSTVIVGYNVNPGGITAGALSLFNEPVPDPVSMPVRPSKAGPAGLALAAMALLGLGFRKRGSRLFLLALLAAGTFAGLGAVSGCGGGKSVVTPGTYSYTVKGLDTNSNVVTSTFTVTVP